MIRKETVYQSKKLKHSRFHWLLVLKYRSSRPEVLCKKDVLRSFIKFTGKHLCQSLSFNKVAGLRPETCNFIKKRLWHSCFPVDFEKFLGIPFFIEHLLWLLLKIKLQISFYSVTEFLRHIWGFVRKSWRDVWAGKFKA